MTMYTNSAVVTAPIDEVFDLVNDVERYPEFVPLWRRAEVVQHANSSYVTEQEVGLGKIVHSFRSRTEVSRPDHIEVSSEDPLFREFFIRWDFSSVGNGCRITVALSWEMRAQRLQGLMDELLPQLAKSIFNAFKKRIDHGQP